MYYHYYATPRGPKGRGVAPIGAKWGYALVFIYLFWLLYAMGLYTYQKIHVSKIGLLDNIGSCYSI